MKVEKFVKLKLVKIWEILSQETDEEHPMSTTELLAKLEELGIPCERRTLYIQYTGVSNRIIKENFLFLKNSGKPFLIRTPLIEGKTDSKENLRKIKEFIGDVKWERLPENKLGLAKKEMLNV